MPGEAVSIPVPNSATREGNTMRENPLIRMTHPITVTNTGQPPVHRLWKQTIASPGTKAT